VHKITAGDVRRHFGNDPFTFLVPDATLEKHARRRVDRTSEGVTKLVQTIGRTPSPKEAFLGDITTIFAFANDERSPKRVAQVISAASSVQRVDPPHSTFEIGPGMFNKARNLFEGQELPFVRPMLSALFQTAPKLRGAILSSALFRTRVKIATPEIMQGVRAFLQAHGREADEVRVSNSRIRDFLMTRDVPYLSSMTRKRLSTVAGQVEKILTDVYDLLPEDGKRFEEGVKHVVVQAIKAPHDIKQTAKEAFRTFSQRRPSTYVGEHRAAAIRAHEHELHIRTLQKEKDEEKEDD
jgi:hypothetical protein